MRPPRVKQTHEEYVFHVRAPSLSHHFGIEHDRKRREWRPFAFDQLAVGLDQGAWDQPIAWEGPVRHVSGDQPVRPKGKGYLLFDLCEGAGHEHRFQPAANVLETVVRLWRNFIKTYRPADDIPISAHHAD